jgi:hypothetical protein
MDDVKDENSTMAKLVIEAPEAVPGGAALPALAR